MIYISAIKNCLFHNEEKDWALATNLINDSYNEKLLSSYPCTGFTKSSRTIGPKKHYSFSILDLVLNNRFDDEAKLHVNNIWYDLAKSLMSVEYISAISQIINKSLSEIDINIGFYKFDSGDWVAPHIDNDNKILTQIFYFNKYWSTDWGGYLKLLKSNQPESEYFSAPPLSPFSVLISRTEKTWHMVSPVNSQAKQPRLSMQLELLKKSK